jgi:transcription initiation factor TFIIH subunit 4
LNLFVQLQSRFRNMVTGVITRDSIRNALIKGITAEQIIYYMQSHAHSQMRKKVDLTDFIV